MSTEARFSRTPDGAVWTSDGPAYRFWTRYLSVFDEVRVVARVRDTADPGAKAVRTDGSGVHVWPVPYYVGAREYLATRAAIGRVLRSAADRDDAVILRVPSPIGTRLAAHRDRQRLPYALEVVGDPYDVFAPGVLRHPLRPLLRRRFADRLRRECRSAVAASYVTESHLQARYPAGPDVPTAAISSIDLPVDAFVERPRVITHRGDAEPTLISIGTMDQLYKGIDVLIEALARLNRAGAPARLIHLGTGRYRPDLERLAERLGVADRVRFEGWCPPGTAVRRQLDAADLFVMPSRTEGLPRALIEAMARALPAVGTRVGGIPELLEPADLVGPDDPEALAAAVAGMLGDPRRMTAASARNLTRARRYSRDSLAPRREAFYRAVRQATTSNDLARSR
ncbi:glycosyltransferase [Micromonospora sp. NPDC047670]|uniref:glycosyltransferase n=1 Tax=Micromonospora sp. NPDC047670 TaxID=3364252 RepID=UPI00371C3170